MTTNYHCAVHLKSVSGLPADDAILTVNYQRSSDAISTDFDTWEDIMNDFLNNTTGAQVKAIGKYLGQDRDRTADACRVDFYKIPGAAGPMGPPVASRTLSLPVRETSVPLPDQVAFCSSYHADLAGVVGESGGTNQQARRRGRFFLGPLNSNTLQETGTATAPQTPLSQFMTDVVIATHVQLLTNMASEGWTWVVFSRRAWTAFPVVGGFVDDRFDTQRRRLENPSARLSWP